MQKLETKDKGTYTFKRTWIIQGVGHIGLLAGGGYCHVGGQPIQKAAELRHVIPKGPELDAALEWFTNRDKVKPAEQKRIVIEPNGDFHFDDGSPITSMSDLINNLPPGPILETAQKLFVLKQMDADKVQFSKVGQQPKNKEQDAVEKLKASLQDKKESDDDAEREAEQDEP
jgi:hypothetical protein